MYDSIQFSKAASFRITSQITWPNDNKAAGNCFHALVGGLRPASLILARRIAFWLVLLGAGLVLIQPCAGQSGTWTPTGSLATARYGHTATLLPNGKVLVAGGGDSFGQEFASAELYDPATGLWAATGSMSTARVNYTATLLPNGKVLVAGGLGNGGVYLASEELYEPATGLTTTTSTTATPRNTATTTLQHRGGVLDAGGGNDDDLGRAGVYDEATG